MTEYEKEADPATMQFWQKVMDDVRNSTSKKILLKAEQIETMLKEKHDEDGKVKTAVKRGIMQCLKELGWAK